MCIICNCPPFAPEPDALLVAFHASREAMKAAESAMRAVAAVAVSAEDRRRYASVHKQMVRLRREWNKLEQAREHAPPS